MKRLPFVACAAALAAACSPALAQKVGKDEVIVGVLNQQPIRNETKALYFGHGCTVNTKRGTFTNVGRDGPFILVRYSIARAAGDECPSGTIFGIAPQQFAQLAQKN